MNSRMFIPFASTGMEHVRSIDKSCFRYLLCICLIFIISFSTACGTASDIEAGRHDLPDSIQTLLIHKYGRDQITGKVQFGPMKTLQDLYGRFIPYYVTGYFNSDNCADFAAFLLRRKPSKLCWA